MDIIYAPAGRAQEYCRQAANLYRGCGHGCLYCYAPDAIRESRETFYAAPKPRAGVMQALRKQLNRTAFTGPVLLCFTCDPYQPINDEYDLAGQAIRVLKQHGVPIELLTKGGKRAGKDLHLLGAADQVGATLTFVSDADSRHWEPGAALPAERFELLKEAKRLGIPTWASLEPVIDPVQTLRIIADTRAFVDLYKVGKLNHHPLAARIDWARFATEARRMLVAQGSRHYLKEDLRQHLAPLPTPG